MRLALFLFLSALCATAHAQTIYRSVMPDGKIVFGDKPAPGAKESKPVAQRPPNISVPGPTSGGDAPSRQPALEATSNEVNVARQRLEAAQKALEDGREPREGERTGIAKKGGGSGTNTQLNEGYNKRINALEQDVSTAQRELEEAQGKRNNAR